MPDTASLSISETRTYSISELAREFGITPRALRFYEDKDMLHPARDGMTRVYSHRDRARVTIIVRMKRLGLPLADIREILDLYGLGDNERAQKRKTLEKFRNGIVPLSVLNSLIWSWIVRFKEDYLRHQTYFQPFPESLLDHLDSGKKQRVYQSV